MDIHKELQGEEIQDSLRVVFALTPRELARPTKSELLHIERVLNIYDLLGLRAKQRAIITKDLLESDWRIVPPLWEHLQPFVSRQRTLRDSAQYKQWLEWLVSQAEHYRVKNGWLKPKRFSISELVRSEGCSIVFVNAKKNILLYRRDDAQTVQSLKEPSKWDLFGGTVENGETPDQAIIREVGEELAVTGKSDSGIVLTGHRLFKTSKLEERDEHTYWARLDETVDNLQLREGVELKWFTVQEITAMKEDDVAFDFLAIIREFLASSAFRHLP